METPEQQFNSRVSTSFGDAGPPSQKTFVMASPIQTPGARPRKTPEVDVDRLRRPSPPTAELKPIADGIRRERPFGSPKPEGRHDRTRRRSGGHARRQADPPRGGTGACVRRHRRWRDHPPLCPAGSMDGPPSLVSVRPPAALREGRLSGFPRALAVVPRHPMADRRRRVSDPSVTGSLDAAKVGEPAYAVLNTAAWQGRAPPPFDPPGFRARHRRGRERGNPPPERRPHSRPRLSGGGRAGNAVHSDAPSRFDSRGARAGPCARWAATL